MWDDFQYVSNMLKGWHDNRDYNGFLDVWGKVEKKYPQLKYKSWDDVTFDIRTYRLSDEERQRHYQFCWSGELIRLSRGDRMRLENEKLKLNYFAKVAQGQESR